MGGPSTTAVSIASPLNTDEPFRLKALSQLQCLRQKAVVISVPRRWVYKFDDLITFVISFDKEFQTPMYVSQYYDNLFFIKVI